MKSCWKTKQIKSDELTCLFLIHNLEFRWYWTTFLIFKLSRPLTGGSGISTYWLSCTCWRFASCHLTTRWIMSFLIGTSKTSPAKTMKPLSSLKKFVTGITRSWWSPTSWYNPQIRRLCRIHLIYFSHSKFITPLTKNQKKKRKSVSND